MKYRRHSDPKAWMNYLDQVGEWHKVRQVVIGEAFGQDPFDILVEALRKAFGRVEPACDPLYGRPVFGGIVRSGVTILHYDDGAHDLKLPSTGTFTTVLTLNMMPGAVLRCYRKVVTVPDYEVPIEPTGHYDLPRELITNVEFDDIATPVGSIAFLSSRHLHEVLDFEDRLTVAMNVARLADGRIVYYS